jgi:hypothetical protein
MVARAELVVGEGRESEAIAVGPWKFRQSILLRAPKRCRSGNFIDNDMLWPNGRGEFFNRSTSILIAAARIALEPSQRISRVERAGGNQKPFWRLFLRDVGDR